MRSYRHLVTIILFFVCSPVATGVANDEVSVDLGVSAVHERVVTIVKDHYGLHEVEQKVEKSQKVKTASFLFSADPALKTPEILATISVQALATSDTDKAPFIAISFSALPRITIDAPESSELSAFVNRWNLSPYPVRLAILAGHLTSLSVIVIEPGVSLSADRIQREFSWVLQSVPRILYDLRGSGLL